MRWYVEPLAADQRRLQRLLLKLVDALSERADAAAAAREQAERLVRELEERLARLERRGPQRRWRAAPATVAAQPAAAARCRTTSRSRAGCAAASTRSVSASAGTSTTSATRLPCSTSAAGAASCSALLREAGVEARGIDADADMVAYARGEGLDVEQADLVEYLEALDDGSLGGDLHGPGRRAPAGRHARADASSSPPRSCGRAAFSIAETINPLSPIALRNYFADLTHAQPLVPETLELLARQSGFAETEIRFLNEPAERLTEPDDPVIAANVRRLNDLLFAPLDYALVARTAAHE